MFEAAKVKMDEDGSDTMDQAWRIIVWSLWFMYLGVWPTHDHLGQRIVDAASAAIAGTELANGYFCAPWLIKGDLDWFAKHLRLKSYSANQPCDFCPVDKDAERALWPTSFHPTAPWKRRLLSARDWREQCAARGAQLHPLFNMPFLSQLNVEPDELHVLYLGVVPYLLGSVLWLLVYRLAPPGQAAQSRMEAIWHQVTAHYHENQTSCQLSNLTLSMWHDPAHPRKAYPRLKAKGGEAKWLVPALAAVWQSEMRLGDA